MRIKYPRTPHLPFSETITKDDRVLKDISHFVGKEIVITEKMDGENTTIYNDYYHARSLSSSHQSYHSWLLSYMRNFMYSIPENWRVCGEYLYVTHSIKYNNLKNYFLVFSVWDDKNNCLSWKDTEKFCKERNLDTVPVIYKGIFDEDIVKKEAIKAKETGKEGIVIRLADSFAYDDFAVSVAKYVRPNHVQSDTHWTKQAITINELCQNVKEM